MGIVDAELNRDDLGEGGDLMGEGACDGGHEHGIVEVERLERDALRLQKLVIRLFDISTRRGNKRWVRTWTTLCCAASAAAFFCSNTSCFFSAGEALSAHHLGQSRKQWLVTGARTGNLDVGRLELDKHVGGPVGQTLLHLWAKRHCLSSCASVVRGQSRAARVTTKWPSRGLTTWKNTRRIRG